MNVRPQRDDDYEAIAEIWNASFPFHPGNAAEIRADDAARPKKIRWGRRMLEVDGYTVGFGYFGNAYDTFHPQEFTMTLVLRPKDLGRGYGRTLFESITAELAAYRPRSLAAWTREDMPRALRFYRDRGFTESMRSFQSILDVAAFDAAPYAGHARRLAEQGIAIRSMVDLESDPDFRRKLYALHIEIDRDVPLVGTFSEPSFEEFCNAHFNDRLYPAGLLVATAGDRYVGLCELVRSKADDDLHNGLTGVLRPWRRKGVALGLKLASIEAARADGAAAIRTWNASNNRGMLTINERLGFAKRPATIDLKRQLAPGAEGGADA
jgi:GNAT superfamily N-acetyltransferase